MLMTVKAMLFH